MNNSSDSKSIVLFTRRNLFVAVMVFVSIFFLCGCSSDKNSHHEVTVIYTNDVHTHIDNNKSDSSEEKSEEKKNKLSYASIAALKKDLEKEGKHVVLVDAGDHSQGTAFGSMDKGKSIIQIMNSTGYQVATLGNHEFDYGLTRTFEMIDEAKYQYLSSNFYETKSSRLMLPAYKILNVGDTKVAFVGISTPESITASNPTYFMDEDKKNYLYNFYSGDDGKELYDSVQKAIDKVKNKSDYVIALAHLGVDASSKPYRSEDVIAHTSGLNAFIDGHSHTSMERSDVPDMHAGNVVLTQTGSYLDSVGVMTLEKAETGTPIIETKLIKEYENRDETIENQENQLIERVKSQLGEKIASTDSLLVMSDPDGNRIVRNQETNLGDLSADCFYYYFNDVMKLDCDIAIQNGGGIRSSIEPGDITYMTAKTVFPYGNATCLVEATGQQILDALEMGAMSVGEIDPATNKPAENGGFLQVAGVKFKINSPTKSTVQVDSDGIWKSSPTGAYKVHDVEVYNRDSGEYQPLDLTKIYRIGGVSYILRNQGNGMSMFKDCNPIVDGTEEDYVVFAEYLKAFKDKKISTENSPILSKYSGYNINYEDTQGSARIVIE